MNPYPLDHVGIATPSIQAAAAGYERLTGAGCSPVEALPEHGVNVAFVGMIELLEPRGAESAVARFLARRGPGLHHLAYRVPDIHVALATLVADGFEAIDAEPRTGAGGHLIAFLHPRATGGVLWELVQR